MSKKGMNFEPINFKNKKLALVPKKKPLGARVRKLEKELKPECKSLVVSGTPAANSGGVIQLLSAVVRGDTDVNRDGNEITGKALWIKGFCAVTPGTGVDQLHRVMIIRDKKPNGALPAVGDVLAAATVYAFPEKTNNTRFKCIMDKTYALNATAEAGSIRYFKKYINLKNRKIYYNDNSLGDIRDAEQDCYYILVIGTSAAGVTAGTVNYNTKLYFTDI